MPLTLSTTQKAGLETNWYSVSDFGFTSVRITEIMPSYFNSFHQTQIPAAVFFPDMQNAETGDFNGDGYADVAITWSFWTHFLPRAPENQAQTRLFFNDGTGKLVANNALFTEAASHDGNLYNETAVADFNGDGRDDFINAPAGLDSRLAGLPGAGYFPEPIALTLSGPGGAFFDATTWIQNQENGTAYNGFFAHDISAGDFDKDGDIDIFSNRSLLLNDGTGHFRNADSQLPATIKDNTKLMLASAAADFDGDGYADVVSFGGMGNSPSATAGGYLMLSKGSANISQRTVVSLPPGPLGAAITVTRDATTGDIDSDGDVDIVALSSRDAGPTANMGVALQIFVNDGSGAFTDATSARINNSRLADLSAAGGNTNTTAYGGTDVALKDWNGDGHADLILTSGKGPGFFDRPLLNIFQNDGTGKFEWIELDMLAWASARNIPGQEKFSPGPLRQSAAVNLNGDRMIDFVSVIATPRADSVTDPEELTAYTILSKAVYGTGPKGIDGATVGAPGFNETYYLNTNASAATAVAQAQYATGLAHYLAVGQAAGLKAFAPGTHVYGASGNDTIMLREGNEQAFGDAGNDLITGGAGNDTIDGGAGLDTAKFSGNRAGYTITRQGASMNVGGPDGSDTLMAVERLEFADRSIAYDLDGNAGFTARVLGAVFGKATVGNAQYAGIGIDLLDGGMGQQALMQLALQKKLGAAPANADVVNLLYTNVIGTTPDATNFAYYKGLLDNGSISQASLGVLAANHALNAASIGLVGLMQTGIEFL
jgi:hypothetical protein